MKWQKQHKHDEEISYWQSIADGLAALLLMVLLLLVVLGLMISTHTKDHDPSLEWMPYPEYAPYDGDTFDDDDDGGGNDYTTEPTQHHDGGGGETEPTHTTEPTDPTEIHSSDDGDAAVLVRVIDAETQRLIREAGVTFELYTDRSALEVLSTYYPHKIEYRDYATTENGTFFLPEKVEPGNYYLEEKTEPKGYDAVERTALHIWDAHDWEDPYVVDVLLYPSRNTIGIQLRDQETGEGVPGAEFDIFACGDVITMDGTLRFSDGQLADHILCNEDGYGESIELYLGSYQLRQTQIPKYYAANPGPIDAKTTKRVSSFERQPIALMTQKTKVILSVCDELYRNQPVSRAIYALSAPGIPTEHFVSDAAGNITFTNLEKDTTYTVVQEDSDNGYYPTAETLSFYVSPEGLVDGTAVTALNTTNRTLRVSIHIHDAMLPGTTAASAAVLTDAAGNAVDRWTVSSAGHICEGLRPGLYSLRVNNQIIKEISVEETSDIQHVFVSIWTTTSVVVLGGGICVLTAGLYFCIRALKKKR